MTFIQNIRTILEGPEKRLDPRLGMVQHAASVAYFDALLEARSPGWSKPHGKEDEFCQGALRILDGGYAPQDLNLFGQDQRHHALKAFIAHKPVGVRENLFSMLAWNNPQNKSPTLTKFLANAVYHICPTTQRARRIEHTVKYYERALRHT